MTEMFIERSGHGPNHLLGIHGWSGDHSSFDPVSRDLPAAFTFWSVDLPGCGQSPPPHTWTFDTVTNDLVAVLRDLPSPIHLVGNCSGALFALHAASNITGASRLISRISMIDAFAWWPWYFRVFLAPGWGRYAYLTAFANPMGRWLGNLSLARHRNDSTNLTDGFSRVDHATTYRYLEMLRDIAEPESFGNVSCDIDIFYGERSFAAVRQSASRWQRIFPQARASILKGAGHLPILEATAQLRHLLFEENPCLNPSTNCAR